MHEKSLVFFPRSHNPNLNLMCKSIWNTNYARWKAHTLCSLRLTPPNSITENLEFRTLGALGMITTIITHNALTLPHSKETTFEETKASEKWQWRELEDVKPSTVELCRAMTGLCQPTPLPRDSALFWARHHSAENSSAFKNRSKESIWCVNLCAPQPVL